MRCIVLSDAAADPAYVTWQMQSCTKLVELGHEVYSSRDVFAAFEARAGGKIRGIRWGPWKDFVCTNFDVYLRLFDVSLGAINGSILYRVVGRKPAFFLPSEYAAWVAIASVEEHDPENWTAGWMLTAGAS